MIRKITPIGTKVRKWALREKNNASVYVAKAILYGAGGRARLVSQKGAL